MLDNDVSAKVLEALNPLKPWNRMEQLNSHWTQNLCKWKIETHSHVWPHDMCFFTNRSSMQEEQVSAGSWVLHSIFNEVNNSVAFELRETAKAEVTCTRICIGKTWYQLFCSTTTKHRRYTISKFLPWSCSILTWRTNPLSLKVRLQEAHWNFHRCKDSIILRDATVC